MQQILKTMLEAHPYYPECHVWHVIDTAEYPDRNFIVSSTTQMYRGCMYIGTVAECLASKDVKQCA